MSSSNVMKKQLWSGKRDSNPPPTAWKAVALPDELLPQKNKWERKDSNLRRLSQQIYSLSHLTALELSHRCFTYMPEPIVGLEPTTG